MLSASVSYWLSIWTLFKAVRIELDDLQVDTFVRHGLLDVTQLQSS
jgi:hypothetical protein